MAIKHDGGIIQYLPIELITKKLCESAVQQNGCVLGYILKEFLTEDLCVLAVKHNRKALYYVPDDLKEIVLNHVRINICKK